MLYFHKVIKNRLKNRRILILPPGSPPSWTQSQSGGNLENKSLGWFGNNSDSNPTPCPWIDGWMHGWMGYGTSCQNRVKRLTHFYFVFLKHRIQRLLQTAGAPLFRPFWLLNALSYSNSTTLLCSRGLQILIQLNLDEISKVSFSEL